MKLKLVLLALLLVPALTSLGAQGNTRKGGLGVGYGLPYAGLGVNADVYLLDSAGLTASIGSNGYTAGYAIGAKYLHGESKDLWRPQAILLYGTNGVLPAGSTTSVVSNEAYSGFTVALGSQFMFGEKRKHGFDVGATFVLSSGLYPRLKELEEQGEFLTSGSRFSFYLGYRLAFNLPY